jgi:hypothetical protein
MANLKISQLTNSPAQNGDLIPVERSGANYAVSAASILALSAGANVCSFPQVNGENGGLQNYTLIIKIPATWILATGSSVIATVMTGSNLGATGFVMSAATIGTVNAGVLGGLTLGTYTNPVAWTQRVPITFPAGSFAAANTRYPSNPVSITIDTAHDIYVLLYMDATNTSNVPMFTTVGAGTQYVYLGGYVTQNHTNDADSSLVQTPNGSGINGLVQLTVA